MKKIRNLLITSIVFYVVLKLTGCSTGRPPDIYIIEQTTTTTTTATPDITSNSQNTVETEEPENIILPVLPEYQETYNKNNDMIGWIQIPDTAINYPIFQTDNNSDYLELNAEKQTSKSGAIFMDYKCNYHKSDNIIIYGHNLLSGEGFANLGHYYPWSASSNGSLDFYKKHPVIIYNDIYTKTRNQYKIFAGIFTTADVNDNLFFNYHNCIDFESPDIFYDYIANILDRTTFYTDVDIEYGDEIITLSTCMYLLGREQDTRFVLFARRIRENESSDINTNNAVINTDPLYFQKYYDMIGTQWYGRNWPASKITGYEQYLKGE